jgi:hypothetical protein
MTSLSIRIGVLSTIAALAAACSGASDTTSPSTASSSVSALSRPGAPVLDETIDRPTNLHEVTQAAACVNIECGDVFPNGPGSSGYFCGDCPGDETCQDNTCVAPRKCTTAAQCCSQAGGAWNGRYCVLN